MNRIPNMVPLKFQCLFGVFETRWVWIPNTVQKGLGTKHRDQRGLGTKHSSKRFGHQTQFKGIF